MQPEPTPGRRPAKAWITAALGITLVAVAAVTLLMTAVFSKPNSRTGWESSAAQSADPVVAASGGSASGIAGLGGNTSASASADPALVLATPAPVITTNAPTTVTKAPTTTTKAPTTTKQPSAAKLSGEAAFEAEVLTLVNQQRAKANCQPLTADARLAKAAKGHSADMAARDYFNHTTPEGVKFSTRITNAGYQWSAVAENIAAGQKDPASVMTAWMNSAGHRANILNCAYRNLGVGLAYDANNTPYWTQDFGTAA